MTIKRFKAIARRALRSVPEEFLPYVEDIDIVVRRRPSKRMLRELEIPDDEALFGLYDGPCLLERHVDDSAQGPSQITLFFEPLLNACETREELIREIQVTVLHEIGHHFGLDEARLAELGFD